MKMFSKNQKETTQTEKRCKEDMQKCSGNSVCRGGRETWSGGRSGWQCTQRSINITLCQHTHKVEYSVFPQELRTSGSEGRVSVATPLCIDYGYLWHPRVSCSFSFFSFAAFLIEHTALMLAVEPITLIPPSAATKLINFTALCLHFQLMLIMRTFHRYITLRKLDSLCQYSSILFI